jgi:hypothetical protein
MAMQIVIALILAIAFSAPMHAQVVPTWDPDSDGDNLITVDDLLALLSVFVETDLDDDGIFDSQDDCIGSNDACGVCNGTGVDVDSDVVCDIVDPCEGTSTR